MAVSKPDGISDVSESNTKSSVVDKVKRAVKREPSGPSVGDRVVVITDELGTQEIGQVRSVGDGDRVDVVLRPEDAERSHLAGVLWVKDEESAEGESRPVCWPIPLDDEPAEA